LGYKSKDFAETMPPEKTVFYILKEQYPAASDAEVRNLLGGFGFSGDSIHKKCEVLSGGEKIRLAFARLFIRPPNFLLLDEPTTHLDVEGREALEEALKSYQGALCVVSHDVEFVRHIAEHTIAIDEKGVTRYPGGYAYYLEKTQNQEPPSSSPSQEAKKIETVPAKGKDARKARAQRREAEKILRKIEQEIDRLTEEQTALTQEMMENRSADFASINSRLAQIQQKISTLESDWESAAEELS
jgi:ATP-binding cassette subfamily F protein 3